MWRPSHAAMLGAMMLASGNIGAGAPPDLPQAGPPPMELAGEFTAADLSGPEAPAPLYAVPTSKDRVGRIVVPVMVNGHGPFHFVLDTGANTTVLAPHLAEAIGLTVDSDQMVTMSGVTGSLPVPTARVESVTAGAVALDRQRLAVADASVVGTDGILGVDGLQGKLILADFEHDRIEVLDARLWRPAPKLVRIHARTRFGKLLVIDALVGTIKVKAVIDTGGQRTLGNSALYAQLGLRPSMTVRDETSFVIGATDSRQQGERYVVRRITLAQDFYINNLAVIFGDFFIFKLWDFEHIPALVIGMDMIGTLNTFGVDYLRSEIQVRAGRQWGSK
jgi:hypothetical protein